MCNLAHVLCVNVINFSIVQMMKSVMPCSVCDYCCFQSQLNTDKSFSSDNVYQNTNIMGFYETGTRQIFFIWYEGQEPIMNLIWTGGQAYILSFLYTAFLYSDLWIYSLKCSERKWRCLRPINIARDSFFFFLIIF
uniref:Uncharacterized protein n=1 Tax=Oryza barthii TaxID=65489 RepID=A0A0D3FPE9_9ORYZ